jgi:hypothetical protein
LLTPVIVGGVRVQVYARATLMRTGAAGVLLSALAGSGVDDPR